MKLGPPLSLIKEVIKKNKRKKAQDLVVLNKEMKMPMLKLQKKMIQKISILLLIKNNQVKSKKLCNLKMKRKYKYLPLTLTHQARPKK